MKLLEVITNETLLNCARSDNYSIVSCGDTSNFVAVQKEKKWRNQNGKCMMLEAAKSRLLTAQKEGGRRHVSLIFSHFLLHLTVMFVQSLVMFHNSRVPIKGEYEEGLFFFPNGHNRVNLVLIERAKLISLETKLQDL